MEVKAQVRRSIEQHRLLAPGDKIVVGVSGGPDSLALLHVLRALSDDLQITLYVAHLNHQLRGAASDEDSEFVANLAREWGLPATIESRDVAALAREQHLSIEEAARDARYDLLAEVAARVGARVIAVAHNADDQVETILMHLLRGSGMAGLRGMAYESQALSFRFQDVRNPEPDNWNLKLIRPLLDVTRVEIEAYCKENALSPRMDESNLDATFFRNRLRLQVIPYLETLNPNLRPVLRRMAQSITDDYAFLHRQTQDAFAQVARAENGAIVFALQPWRALDPALQRGTLRMAVQQLRRDLRNVDWTHIEDARRVALEKETGAMATLPDGLMLAVGYDAFTIGNTRNEPLPDLPLLQVESIALAVPGVTPLPGSDWLVEREIVARVPDDANRWVASLDFDKVGNDLFLRRRRPGDRFEPLGLGHSKSLHEFMIDAKIPQAVRDQLPLLVARDRIVWVCGWRIDERARVTPQTKQVLQVSFKQSRMPTTADERRY